MVSLVVAQAQNRVIGRDNRVPWRLRSDLVRLKRLTKDKVVILVRRSYESMDDYYTGTGREMPGRKYLVITRDQDFAPQRQNAKAVFSVQQALDMAKQLKAGETFVIGGGSIYKEALPLADRIYMTKVMADFEGDTFFPKLKANDWVPVERELHAADENNEYAYEFVTLERPSETLQS